MYIPKLVAKIQASDDPQEVVEAATYVVGSFATVRDAKEELHYFKNNAYHRYHAVDQIICRIEDDQGRLLEYFVPIRWGYESTFTCPHCKTEHNLPYDGEECTHCHMNMNTGDNPLWLSYPEKSMPKPTK
jgi:hypothetical protein